MLKYLFDKRVTVEGGEAYSVRLPRVLIEVNEAGEGRIVEAGTDYTFFISGSTPAGVPYERKVEGKCQVVID